MVKLKKVVTLISNKLLSPPVFFIIINKFNVFHVNYNVFFYKKNKQFLILILKTSHIHIKR